MLIKCKDSAETYRHLCDGKNANYIKSQSPVYVHDVHAYMSIGGKHQPVSYCPYCGKNPESEAKQ
jgi:hypothetical protein